MAQKEDGKYCAEAGAGRLHLGKDRCCGLAMIVDVREV
jgi:hypothetical protein